MLLVRDFACFSSQGNGLIGALLTDAVFDGLVVDDAARIGVNIRGGAGIWIERVTVRRAGEYGLALWGTEGAVVRYSRAEDSTWAGMFLLDARLISLRGNVMTRGRGAQGSGLPPGIGLAVVDASDIRSAGDVFTDNAGHGVLVLSGERIEMLGPTVANSGGMGVQIGPPPQARVGGEVVEDFVVAGESTAPPRSDRPW